MHRESRYILQKILDSMGKWLPGEDLKKNSYDRTQEEKERKSLFIAFFSFVQMTHFIIYSFFFFT